MVSEQPAKAASNAIICAAPPAPQSRILPASGILASSSARKKADTVRIIADEVLAAFHGVDRAVKQGFAVYLIEQGKNCSLVRDGEIEAAQSSQGGELLCKLLRWQLPLFINSVHAVNGKSFSWMKGTLCAQADSRARHNGVSPL